MAAYTADLLGSRRLLSSWKYFTVKLCTAAFKLGSEQPSIPIALGCLKGLLGKVGLISGNSQMSKLALALQLRVVFASDVFALVMSQEASTLVNFSLNSALMLRVIRPVGLSCLKILSRIDFGLLAAFSDARPV
jgi:hypothetical protein